MHERPVKRIKSSLHSHDDDDDDDEEQALPSQNLYLDTVDRAALDVDLERICSVTLSDTNVYACLVCGKYFAGRSKATPAFLHSLQDAHHVFLNLTTIKTYILPDGYENTHHALDDIKAAVSPNFTAAQVEALDRDAAMYTDASAARHPFRPGFIGLVASQPAMAVVLQALLHVPAIRNPLLLHNTTTKEDETHSSALWASLSLLTRKLWSTARLKPHTSPYAVMRHLQAALPSLATTADVRDITTCLLHSMARHLPKLRDVRGKVCIETQHLTAVDGGRGDRTRFTADHHVSRTTRPFFSLVLDLPATPLFRPTTTTTTTAAAVTAQTSVVPLQQLLAKYNGVSVQEGARVRTRYVLLRVPDYLILHMPRTANLSRDTETTTTTTNATLVTFPLTGLDLGAVLAPGAGVFDLLVNVTYADEDAVGNAISTTSSNSSGQDRRRRQQQQQRDRYRVQVRDKATDTWMQIEGSTVREIKRDLFSQIPPTIMQIWERKQT